MSRQQYTTYTRKTYVHPDDPAGWLKPDEPLMVSGLDWSWAFLLYKEILRFPGYRFGSNGTIWSCLKRGPQRKMVPSKDWKRLKGKYDRWTGYICVRLKAQGDLQANTIPVHRLILEAFVGPCPEGMEACHRPDRDRTNCRITNLRWDTKLANEADKVGHGTRRTGEQHSQAKLNWQKIAGIHRLRRLGMTMTAIAVRYDVSRSMVSLICSGKKWVIKP